MTHDSQPVRSLTLAEFCRIYRVGETKARQWIARGELAAVNVALHAGGKPRWVVPPVAVAEFERRRRGGDPPKPARRRKKTIGIDFYPD